jgi:hydroxyacylglutathione hydrolase
MIHVQTITALKDNLCYVITRDGSLDAIVIDPSEAAPISNYLKANKLNLILILNTHHHHDHVGGNLSLQNEFRCPVWCSLVDLDLARVPGASRGLKDEEVFTANEIDFKILSIPGHTKGQIAFYIEKSADLFSGDTVFAMGCGRLFEGTAEEMLHSLKRIAQLPKATKVRFGHEYTVRNAEFAVQFEPNNISIRKRADLAIAASKHGELTPPATVQDEIDSNPFFRTSSKEIQQSLGVATGLLTDGIEESNLQVLARLRELRNSF